ncbi:probable cytochrome P450 6a13 [Venturia canescens]|uniref:probable cytochrome P450 6a13 n=1 Tax=Venturia canescens TaxID=32260 RepID=UPI001C9C65BA|nr:probable cytochrome P450 6a13 [Venturia canescens]
MEITTIIITICILLFGYLVYNRLLGPLDYWKSRGIAYASGAIPIFGNTLSVYRLKDNLSTLSARIYEESVGKSVIGFFDMSSPVLMVRDPDLVKVVLQSNFKAFQHNAQILDLEKDPLIGRDPFFLRDKEWRHARPIFASTLSINRIKLMSLDIESACRLMKDYLSSELGDRESLEMDSKLLFSRYTHEVAGRTVFGIEANSFKKNDSAILLNEMKKMLDPSPVKGALMNITLLLPVLNKIIKTSFVPPEVDAEFRKLVQSLEESRKKDGHRMGNDVFGAMLDLHRDNKISREEALAHAFSFFVESFETSSLTLSFVCYELGKNEEIQDNLRQEVRHVLKTHEGRLTYEAIQEMSYMNKVINETLRLYPSVGNFVRLTAEKCHLESADGSRLDLEANSSILIPVLGLHRDPQIWQDPLVFDPERFSKENIDARHKFAYLPFGEGPRACPGSKLGILQVKAAIATILSSYRIQVSPKMIDPPRINPQYFLVSALGGFWMKLRPL